MIEGGRKSSYQKEHSASFILNLEHYEAEYFFKLKMVPFNFDLDHTEDSRETVCAARNKHAPSQ